MLSLAVVPFHTFETSGIIRNGPLIAPDLHPGLTGPRWLGFLLGAWWPFRAVVARFGFPPLKKGFFNNPRSLLKVTAKRRIQICSCDGDGQCEPMRINEMNANQCEPMRTATTPSIDLTRSQRHRQLLVKGPD